MRPFRVLVICGISVLVGCGERPSYEPSDATCAPNYLKGLPADKARQELADKCATRGVFKPSPPKAY